MLWLLVFVPVAVGAVMVITRVFASLEEHAERQRARRNAGARTGKWNHLRTDRDRHIR
jgi:hypothetical protein